MDETELIRRLRAYPKIESARIKTYKGQRRLYVKTKPLYIKNTVLLSTKPFGSWDFSIPLTLHGKVSVNRYVDGKKQAPIHPNMEHSMKFCWEGNAQVSRSLIREDLISTVDLLLHFVTNCSFEGPYYALERFKDLDFDRTKKVK